MPASNSLAEVRSAEARNITMAIYPEDSLESAAVLKVDRVFTDHRHIGFFSVKLLPVVVAQGVRLELASSTPNTNWLASFRANLMPSTRSSSVEWRNCSLWFPHETAPRMEAARVTLNAAGGFCALEDVSLETASGTMKVSRAKLLLGGQPGQVVWQEEAGTARWNLFSKELTNDK